VRSRLRLLTTGPWDARDGRSRLAEAVAGLPVVSLLRMREDAPGALVQLANRRYALIGAIVAAGPAPRLRRHLRPRPRRRPAHELWLAELDRTLDAETAGHSDEAFPLQCHTPQAAPTDRPALPAAAREHGASHVSGRSEPPQGVPGRRPPPCAASPSGSTPPTAARCLARSMQATPSRSPAASATRIAFSASSSPTRAGCAPSVGPSRPTHR
jgi:hypothetical protein